MANTRTIPINSLDLKNSPIVRASNPDKETVGQYAESYKNRQDMPPVVVFYDPDTKKYLLADGRHRCEAAKLISMEEIMAEIIEGDYAACLKHAVLANAKHGVPRSNSDKRQCVRAALLQWGAGVTDSHIASLTLVSDKTVAAVREEMTKAKQIKPAKTRMRADGKPLPVASDQPEPELVDTFGKPIPHKVQKYWARGDELEVILNDTEHVHGILKQAHREKDVMYAELNMADLLSSLEHIRNTLKGAMPYCVCTNCSGHPETQKETCRLCLGRGLIGKFRYDNLVPLEIKEIMKKVRAKEAKK